MFSQDFGQARTSACIAQDTAYAGEGVVYTCRTGSSQRRGTHSCKRTAWPRQRLRRSQSIALHNEHMRQFTVVYLVSSCPGRPEREAELTSVTQKGSPAFTEAGPAASA